MSSVPANYVIGGVIDEVKRIGKIRGFAEFTQPYNVMVTQEIPAIKDLYEITYTTPDYETEILCLTVTCSGYGEQDRYDITFNDRTWFENWATSEVKEGLYLGTSNYVYRAPPNSEFKIKFSNNSGTSKTLYFGVRMLIE